MCIINNFSAGFEKNMVYVKSLQLSSDKERPKTSRESDQKNVPKT